MDEVLQYLGGYLAAANIGAELVYLIFYSKGVRLTHFRKLTGSVKGDKSSAGRNTRRYLLCKLILGLYGTLNKLSHLCSKVGKLLVFVLYDTFTSFVISLYCNLKACDIEYDHCLRRYVFQDLCQLFIKVFGAESSHIFTGLLAVIVVY